MATVRQQLDSKISAGPRPGPVKSTPGYTAELEAMRKEHEMRELEEKVAELKARGIRATVVVEAD